MASHDEVFMSAALAVARRGLGRVWPNPAVGAVLVAPGEEPEILSRGWTMPGGRPHAETVALERAGERARGATLYVSLEPCAHHGKTPPCADAIIAAGVARVVCALGDPDPRVSGKGLERLRDAGILVDSGILAEQAHMLTRGHLLRVGEQRPEVTLKLAVGSDGLIAPGDGAPVWVTGELARARGHLMRARSDAILVGRGTVMADNPELTCRLPGMSGRSPVRVVLDTHLRLNDQAGLLNRASHAPVWIICAEDGMSRRQQLFESKGAVVLAVHKGIDARPDPVAVCGVLAQRGITRLLIEGGPHVARSFLDAGVIDCVAIFRGPAPVGKSGLAPFVNNGLEVIENAEEFEEIEVQKVGEDQVVIYEKKHQTN